jgi:hypothetical protein
MLEEIGLGSPTSKKKAIDAITDLLKPPASSQ